MRIFGTKNSFPLFPTSLEPKNQFKTTTLVSTHSVVRRTCPRFVNTKLQQLFILEIYSFSAQPPAVFEKIWLFRLKYWVLCEFEYISKHLNHFEAIKQQDTPSFTQCLMTTYVTGIFHILVQIVVMNVKQCLSTSLILTLVTDKHVSSISAGDELM